MLIPFGFSIGEFIAGVGAFKTVCLALKDNGGAAAEYQEVSGELQAIEDVIRKVQDLPENTTVDNSEAVRLSKALATQADACLAHVTKFTNKLRRYDPALRAGAPPGSTRATWCKATWALSFSPEWKKFRPEIGVYASNITLSFLNLLYLHSLAAEESSTKQQAQLKESIASGFAALSDKLNLNDVASRSQNTAVLQALNDLATKMEMLENQRFDDHANFKQAMASVVSDTSKQLSELNATLSRLLEEKGAPNTRPLSAEVRVLMPTREQQFPVATTNEQKGRQLTEAEMYAVFRGRARKTPQKLNWGSSIIDFMILLDLDSSIYAREWLAKELDVTTDLRDPNGVLRKALTRELARNSGEVPDNILAMIQR